MNISTYDKVQVTLVRWTHTPNELINLAAQHCMKKPEDINTLGSTASLATFLLQADHGNPFEHVSFTFQINNLSRSGMTQLIRHRIASYTFTSQHYQDYSDYPFIIHPRHAEHEEWEMAFMACMQAYNLLMRKGVPKEEARQVLPNAMGTGCVMTINARSLVNFLRLRLCKRNCAEIIQLAKCMKSLADRQFPELFLQVHTMCVMDGKCNQGAMSCGNPYEA